MPTEMQSHDSPRSENDEDMSHEQAVPTLVDEESSTEMQIQQTHQEIQQQQMQHQEQQQQEPQQQQVNDEQQANVKESVAKMQATLAARAPTTTTSQPPEFEDIEVEAKPVEAEEPQCARPKVTRPKCKDVRTMNRERLERLAQRHEANEKRDCSEDTDSQESRIADLEDEVCDLRRQLESSQRARNRAETQLRSLRQRVDEMKQKAVSYSDMDQLWAAVTELQQKRNRGPQSQ